MRHQRLALFQGKGAAAAAAGGDGTDSSMLDDSFGDEGSGGAGGSGYGDGSQADFYSSSSSYGAGDAYGAGAYGAGIDDSNSPQVALVSVTAGGMGLDLSVASVAVFVELPPDVAWLRYSVDIKQHGRGLA
jgi:hypothetical protein